MIDEPQGTPAPDDEAALDAVEAGRTDATPPDASQPADAVLAALRRERDELYDRLLRATAEFDNYRKRTDRERRETSERVTAAVLEDVLPIVDDFDRALDAEHLVVVALAHALATLTIAGRSRRSPSL